MEQTRTESFYQPCTKIVLNLQKKKNLGQTFITGKVLYNEKEN